MFHSGVRVGDDSYFPRITPESAEAQGEAFMRAHGCDSIEELRALPPEEIMRVTAFEENMPGLGFRPVSYTHLDVYKRQTTPSGSFSIA